MQIEDIKRSFLDGDGVAFEFFYNQFGGYCINRLKINRRCSAELAKEYFIEALIILRENILSERIHELSSPKNYLFKICDNIYLSHLKLDAKFRRHLSDVEYFFYSNRFTQANDDRDEEMYMATKKAWEILSFRCQEIISLFYINQLSMNEIADHMDMANSDVAKTTKARCYKKLVSQAKKYYKDLKED